ncbi:TerB N-terminal domain-containing protein [Paenibacillus sp. FSL W8-0194]|uniref:TerB N-terminal domain-containing protein n=1 Tax=Paenibacillus sp. FSL W8-0194 TaxID=2921711 RepID=UPI0030DB89DF
MNSNQKPLDFAEIDLSAPANGENGPIRELSIPERKEQPAEGKLPFVAALSKEKRFVQQAQAMAERTGEQAPFVPFMSYWPTYEQMNESQRRWYFYWRSEVRSGRFPYTDLSYIFVCLYELIHGVGWERPRQGYEQMMNLWDAYGNRYPKLNQYLAEWVCDFVLVHRLDVPLIDILARSGQAWAGELFDLELERLMGENPALLTLDQILTLSDYDARRSKFYAEEGRGLLEEYTPQVIALVHSYLQKTTGKGLVDTFYKGTGKKIERYLFRSSVYDAETYGRTFPMRILEIRKCPPLHYYVTQLVRCAENKLRELTGFKGRLRGVTLKSETETLIRRFLDKEFAAKKLSVPAVSIDTQKLAMLQKDSEEVRSMLTIEEWDEPAHERNEEGNIPVSPTDLAEHDHAGHSGPEEGFERESSSERVPERPAMEPQRFAWDTSLLDEEWTSFSEQLGPAHLEVLYALKSRMPYSELERIAETYGSMPALLIDEINQAAMETIGDLVIDGDDVAEEYSGYLEALKKA